MRFEQLEARCVLNGQAVLTNDVIELNQNAPQTNVDVLANDVFGTNYTGDGRITGVTSAAGFGTLAIAADGKSIRFTPRAGFTGTGAFSYTVDGALQAEVKVVVNAPAGGEVPTFESSDRYAQFLIDDAMRRYEHVFGAPA